MAAKVTMYDITKDEIREVNQQDFDRVFRNADISSMKISICKRIMGLSELEDVQRMHSIVMMGAKPSQPKGGI